LLDGPRREREILGSTYYGTYPAWWGRGKANGESLRNGKNGRGSKPLSQNPSSTRKGKGQGMTSLGQAEECSQENEGGEAEREIITCLFYLLRLTRSRPVR